MVDESARLAGQRCQGQILLKFEQGCARGHGVTGSINLKAVIAVGCGDVYCDLASLQFEGVGYLIAREVFQTLFVRGNSSGRDIG